MKKCLLIGLIFLFGCQSFRPDLNMITSSVQATSKAARPISDEEEYYVGRAVAARLVATYPLLNNNQLTIYVNLVGQTIALQSEKPFTHGGYHFAILDTNEMNAFACPGGTIFITKGMVRAVRNEDELAAVLAHEIAHINHRDGISSIKQARWAEAATVIGSGVARQYGSGDLARLVSIFEGSIDDVVKTLVVNGYGKSQEYSADQTALGYLAKAGYDPVALEVFLSRIASEGTTSGGLLKTHPATSDRVQQVRSNLPGKKNDTSLLQKRTKRFKESVRILSSLRPEVSRGLLSSELA